MLETPEKVRELQRKLYQKVKQERGYRLLPLDSDCESIWNKMIGKPYSRKVNVRFDEGSWKQSLSDRDRSAVSGQFGVRS